MKTYSSSCIYENTHSPPPSLIPKIAGFHCWPFPPTLFQFWQFLWNASATLPMFAGYTGFLIRCEETALGASLFFLLPQVLFFMAYHPPSYPSLSPFFLPLLGLCN
ncbi:UNVERIFIED_CONTAM: hypothetical protein K2H54_020222 [Gekko kuhli]